MSDIISLEKYLIEKPLYEYFTAEVFTEIHFLFSGEFKIEGICPNCHKDRVFTRISKTDHFLERDAYELRRNQMTMAGVSFDKECGFDFRTIEFVCSKNSEHRLIFTIRLTGNMIQKVGQFPPIVTMFKDETNSFRKSMNDQDKLEYARAIGLASHGVGIGSFVYLRRIFERLITNRYREYKIVEKWDDEIFRKKDMGEKIQYISSHLPKVLVENSKIYSVLSKGIHELNEEVCLEYFSTIRRGIVIILRDDEQKRRDLAEAAELKKSIDRIHVQETQKPK